MWATWREQNNQAFEGLERMTTELKMIVLRSLFDWMAAMPTYWSSNFLVLGLYSSLLIKSLIYPSKKKPAYTAYISYMYITKCVHKICAISDIDTLKTKLLLSIQLNNRFNLVMLNKEMVDPTANR